MGATLLLCAIVACTPAEAAQAASGGLSFSHSILWREVATNKTLDQQPIKDRDLRQLAFEVTASDDGSRATDVELRLSLPGSSYGEFVSVDAFDNTGGARPSVHVQRLGRREQANKCKQNNAGVLSPPNRQEIPMLSAAAAAVDAILGPVFRSGVLPSEPMHAVAKESDNCLDGSLDTQDSRNSTVIIRTSAVALPTVLEKAIEEAKTQRRSRIQRQQQQRRKIQHHNPDAAATGATATAMAVGRPARAVMHAEVSAALWFKRWRRSLDCTCTRYSYLDGEWLGCTMPTLRLQAQLSYTLANATLFRQQGTPCIVCA